MAAVTVMEWERVLRYQDGRLVDLLGPGRHRYRKNRSKLVTVDVRPRVLNVPGQEVLTQDGITVKISAFAVWRISDAKAYVSGARSPEELLYAGLQAAMRDAAAAETFDDVLADRSRLSAGLGAVAQPAVDEVGITIDSASLRDLMLSGELRRARTETILARERGRAELERARAEAASLRSLANTARLLEDHPALLHLRTLDAASQPGSTVVLRPPQREPSETKPAEPGA